MYRIVAPVALAVGAVLHGCGGGDTPTPAPTPAPTPVPKPDIWVEILKPAADVLIDASASWELVGTKEQFTFTEGPVWDTETASWIWSDIPTSIQYQYTPGGAVTEFRNPSNKANGNWLESNGTLLTCEHVGRAVVRMDVATKGDRTVVVNAFNGKKLTSPNDLVVSGKSGALYFTDPSYGTDAGFGHGQPSEQEFNNVFRLDKVNDTFVTEPVSVESGLVQPNGIIFNPQETKLYVSDSGENVDKIYVYDVDGTGSLLNKQVFADVTQGTPDGIRMDTGGHLWSTAGKGVNVYSKDSTLLAIVHTPEGAGNLAFGGADGMDLMITASKSVWIIKTKVRAASFSMGGSTVAFI
jgi:gluconolactonase